MKTRKTIIPKKLRASMEVDPDYNSCSLFGQEGHECGGRITREHAVMAGGKKVQLQWAIIPLCAKGHDVDEYQDSHSMDKSMNEWVALNRAKDEDLLALYAETAYTPLCKAKGIFQRRRYLNSIYGVYKRIYPVQKPSVLESEICYNTPLYP